MDMEEIITRSSICESSSSFFGGWAEGTVFTFNSARNTVNSYNQQYEDDVEGSFEEPSEGFDNPQPEEKKKGIFGRLRHWMDRENGDKFVKFLEEQAHAHGKKRWKAKLADSQAFVAYHNRDGSYYKLNSRYLDQSHAELETEVDNKTEVVATRKDQTIDQQAAGETEDNSVKESTTVGFTPSFPCIETEAPLARSFISFKELVNVSRNKVAGKRSKNLSSRKITIPDVPYQCARFRGNWEGRRISDIRSSPNVVTQAAGYPPRPPMKGHAVADTKPMEESKTELIQGRILKVYGGCVCVVNPNSMQEAMIISDKGTLKVLQNKADQASTPVVGKNETSKQTTSCNPTELSLETASLQTLNITQRNPAECTKSTNESVQTEDLDGADSTSKKTETPEKHKENEADGELDIPSQAVEATKKQVNESPKESFHKTLKHRFKHRSAVGGNMTYRSLFGKRAVYDPGVGKDAQNGFRKKLKKRKQQILEKSGDDETILKDSIESAATNAAVESSCTPNVWSKAEAEESVGISNVDEVPGTSALEVSEGPAGKRCKVPLSSNEACTEVSSSLYQQKQMESCTVEESSSIQVLEEKMLKAFEADTVDDTTALQAPAKAEVFQQTLSEAETVFDVVEHKAEVTSQEPEVVAAQLPDRPEAEKVSYVMEDEGEVTTQKPARLPDLPAQNSTVGVLESLRIHVTPEEMFPELKYVLTPRIDTHARESQPPAEPPETVSSTPAFEGQDLKTESKLILTRKEDESPIKLVGMPSFNVVEDEIRRKPHPEPAITPEPGNFRVIADDKPPYEFVATPEYQDRGGKAQAQETYHPWARPKYKPPSTSPLDDRRPDRQNKYMPLVFEQSTLKKASDCSSRERCIIQGVPWETGCPKPSSRCCSAPEQPQERATYSSKENSLPEAEEVFLERFSQVARQHQQRHSYQYHPPVLPPQRQQPLHHSISRSVEQFSNASIPSPQPFPKPARTHPHSSFRQEYFPHDPRSSYQHPPSSLYSPYVAPSNPVPYQQQVMQGPPWFQQRNHFVWPANQFSSQSATPRVSRTGDRFNMTPYQQFPLVRHERDPPKRQLENTGPHWVTEEEAEIILRIRHTVGQSKQEVLESPEVVRNTGDGRHLPISLIHHQTLPSKRAENGSYQRPPSVGRAAHQQTLARGRAENATVGQHSYLSSGNSSLPTGSTRSSIAGEHMTRIPRSGYTLARSVTRERYARKASCDAEQAQNAASKIQRMWKAYKFRQIISWLRRKENLKARSQHRAAKAIQQAWRDFVKYRVNILPRNILGFYNMIKKRRLSKGLIPPTYERFQKLIYRVRAATEGARVRRRLTSRRLQGVVKEIKEISLFLAEASKDGTSPRLLSQLSNQLEQKRLQLDTALNCPGMAAKFLLKRCPATPIVPNV